MSKVTKLRAELALAELEEELAVAKAALNTPEIAELKAQMRALRAEIAALVNPADQERLAEVKTQVREARRDYRINHRDEG